MRSEWPPDQERDSEEKTSFALEQFQLSIDEDHGTEKEEFTLKIHIEPPVTGGESVCDDDENGQFTVLMAALARTGGSSVTTPTSTIIQSCPAGNGPLPSTGTVGVGALGEAQENVRYKCEPASSDTLVRNQADPVPHMPQSEETDTLLQDVGLSESDPSGKTVMCFLTFSLFRT